MPPKPRLSWEKLVLKLHNPFRVSYGASETRDAFWLRLAEDAGWGEGTIPPYYGVADDDIVSFWQQASHRRDPFPEAPAAIAAWVGQHGPAPARAGLDLALHDRLGRLHGEPLYKLLDLPEPQVLPTSFTIGIDAPEAMAKMASEIPDYPVIKIKLGSDEQDVARVAAIRAARPDVRLRVDANAAWSAEEAVAKVHALLPYDLELVEQPVARNDIEGMGFVQAHCHVPVIADESVQTLADVEALAAAGVQGVNLKLMKLGGLAPTMRVVRRARALGLRIMLGCMVETSLGTTAMAHLAGVAEWLDLDAPLLVANDPFSGVHYDARAGVHLPTAPGIGVKRIE